ncbi:MAG: hypothetical protein JWM28_1690 [Chitinophagaceae bacterium]|nr:hypothetical protein [Chitinophagaceae bacterium]
MLLGIYAAFFVVQFFFNTSSENNFTSPGNIYYLVKTDKQNNLIKGKTTPENKIHIRLNKRFQPTVIPDGAYTGVQIPITYINKSKTDKPKDYLLISFILAASLRGPPSLS